MPSEYNNNNIREDVIFKGKVKDVLLLQGGVGGLVPVLLETLQASSAQSLDEGYLSPKEFLAMLTSRGVQLTQWEQQYLCRSFAPVKNPDVICVKTFVRHFTGLNHRRHTAVQRAWAHVEKNSDGEAARDVLLSTYSGSQADKQNLQTTFKATKTSQAEEAAVNCAEFVAFYAGVSSRFPTDDVFELHMLRVWSADDTVRPTMNETQREWGPDGDPLEMDGPRYVAHALTMELGISTAAYNYSHMVRVPPYVEPLPPLVREEIMLTTTQRTYPPYDGTEQPLIDPLSTRK